MPQGIGQPPRAPRAIQPPSVSTSAAGSGTVPIGMRAPHGPPHAPDGQLAVMRRPRMRVHTARQVATIATRVPVPRRRGARRRTAPSRRRPAAGPGARRTSWAHSVSRRPPARRAREPRGARGGARRGVYREAGDPYQRVAPDPRRTPGTARGPSATKFLRVTTHAWVMRRPWTAPAAREFVTALLASPDRGILVPTSRHADVAAQAGGWQLGHQ